MPASPHSKPRWERRKDARPQELLAAALDLFVERGFAATRLEDVAKMAGVSKGTLYLYFANKEDLFKAMVRENMLPALGEAEDAIACHEGHSAELFRNIMLGWWQRIGETKLSGICKLIMAESGNFPELARFYHEEVISRGDAMITHLLQRGIARGEFRQIDAQQLTNVIVAPVIMLMMWKHSFGACQIERIAPEAYLNSFIDLCLHGLLNAHPDHASSPLK
jgi:AcrR family transcriptional regulator